MIYLATFGNYPYRVHMRILEKSAYNFGVDRVIKYSPESYLSSEFYAKNKAILDQPRGCGYWIWKPWLILETLSIMNEDDVLIYVDAGAEIISPVEPYIKLCREKYHPILFQYQHERYHNIRWSKKEAFEIMGLTEDKYYSSGQVQAGVMVIKNNEFSTEFIKEWLSYCENYDLVSDVKGDNQHPDFVECRWEQSILTFLTLKYDLETCPAQDGGCPKKNRFVNHYRRKFDLIFNKKLLWDAIDKERKTDYILNYTCNHFQKQLEEVTDLNFKLNSGVGKNVSIVSNRLNRIAAYISATRYCEIGVQRGNTFFNVYIRYKDAVDPKFSFNPADYSNAQLSFYPMESDKFFEQLPDLKANNRYDLFYIDGLHTFKQALRDFENATKVSHDKTVFLLDDTCPANCFAAIPDMQKWKELKKYAGLETDPPWQGDVFKVVFALHDFFPEYSYCTVTNHGNRQTIVWKTSEPTHRTPVFDSIESIDKLRYEDFLEYAWMLYPVDDADYISKIYQSIIPKDYQTGDEYKRVMDKFVTDSEKVLKKQLTEANARVVAETNAVAEAKARAAAEAKVSSDTEKELQKQLAEAKAKASSLEVKWCSRPFRKLSKLLRHPILFFRDINSRR